MHEKFSFKSARCKGIAFHPTRPLILVSLHTGMIQLWDYSLKALVDKFEDHDGPVRSVDFHPNPAQPLFASGGDDYKVKLWSLKEKKCLADLSGHLDYVRCVQFHGTQPWILSASDDQTIRIWNWQSRQCIAILTGHNHYVMSACFSPYNNDGQYLLASASLDQTIRIWDLSVLVKRDVDVSSKRERELTEDVFGQGSGADVPVKFVLEGHERGINWVAFHPSPSTPMLVSGGDDRVIKLWRYNDVRAWEVDSIRGHTNNVSCVAFVPKHDYVVSDSEDRSVRVWDLNKRTPLTTVRRDHDRFWTLAVHPENTLMAVGHDSGVAIYKLARERVPFSLVDPLFNAKATQQSEGGLPYVAYMRDRNLRLFDIATGKDKVLLGGRRSNPLSQGGGYRSMSYSSSDRALLVGTDAEYETYSLSPSTAGSMDGGDVVCVEGQRGMGSYPTFYSRSRFVVIDATRRQLVIKSLQDHNNVIRVVSEAGAEVSRVWHGPPGTVLVRNGGTAVSSSSSTSFSAQGSSMTSSSGNGSSYGTLEDGGRVRLIDLGARRVLGEAYVPHGGCKYVAWAPAFSLVALVGRRDIVVCTRGRLERVAAVSESAPIKSAVWTLALPGVPVLIYSTASHIKYLLPTLSRSFASVPPTSSTAVPTATKSNATNDDGGVVCTLPKQPMYLAHARPAASTATTAFGVHLMYTTKDGALEGTTLDASEYMFKAALAAQRLDVVRRILLQDSGVVSKGGKTARRMRGRALVAYLHRRGHPQLAMRMVSLEEDPLGRFHLALECGDLDEALRAVSTLAAAAVAASQSPSNSNESTDENVVRECWKKLSDEALRQGNVALAETAMQKTRDAERLSFLYLITGNVEKMAKMAKVAEMRNDTNSIFQIALLRGDAATQKKLLESAGHASLAARIGTAEEEDALSKRPQPVLAAEFTTSNWPLLHVEQTASQVLAGDVSFSAANTLHGAAAAGSSTMLLSDATADETEADEGAWGVDMAESGDHENVDAFHDAVENEEGAGWDVEDVDVPDLPSSGVAAHAHAPSSFVVPPHGQSVDDKWISTSQLAADHVAAGSFDTALRILHRTVGAVRFEALKEHFLHIYLASHVLRVSGFPSVNGSLAGLFRSNEEGQSGDDRLPKVPYTLAQLQEIFKNACASTTAGKFSDARAQFKACIAQLLLTVVHNKEQVAGIRELLEACREYILAMTLEISRRDPATATDKKRVAELAAYFTHCKILPVHVMLSLRSAMTVCYNLKNYDDAASFARRLLDRLPKPEVADQARKVAAFASENPGNAVQLEYNERNPFVVCAKTLTPIYRGAPIVKCPLCLASFKPECKGQVCPVCDIAQVGLDAAGLFVSQAQFR
eukprot:ANDGO_05748.mRNA.1 Coatomer subunit alpha-1